MAVIKVPKPPMRAFNPERRASKLLLDQIEHLEWAIRPASERRGGKTLRSKSIRTEGQAAERIAQLTKELHPEGAQSPAPVESRAATGARPQKQAKNRPKTRPKNGSKTRPTKTAARAKPAARTKTRRNARRR